MIVTVIVLVSVLLKYIGPASLEVIGTVPVFDVKSPLEVAVPLAVV